jgi:pimeloyl-ACP methyl ester carboxylesterase
VIAEVNGHALYYEVSGAPNGPWVVALHHGLGAVPAWSGQIPALGTAGFRVLAYDRWGYGRSAERDDLPVDYLDREPGDLLALMDLLGLEQAHLLGHSDGGTIALLFAARYPQRVRRMVVAAAHIYNEEVGREGLRQTLERYQREPAFRAAFLALHGERSDRIVLRWLNRILTEEAVDLEMRALLADIRAPTLVIQGELDEFASQQHARDIAAGIREAELWLIPGCRHNPNLERTAEFNTRVIEFLARPGPAAA